MVTAGFSLCGCASCSVCLQRQQFNCRQRCAGTLAASRLPPSSDTCAHLSAAAFVATPQVIHDCALELDLQILPKGDQSKAGLRGINLSGGQRQRLNLARAAYFNGDLLLLDNALSAVDHHTAHHIFGNLLKDTMCEKATVLITHQVEFLPQCDKVAIMDEGNMIYFGPWNAQAQQLLSRVLPTSHLLAAAGNAEQPKDAPKKKPSASSSNLSLSATNIKDNLGKKKERPSTSLTLGQATWVWTKYCRLGFHVIGILSLVWFLTAQTSRQISDYW